MGEIDLLPAAQNWIPYLGGETLTFVDEMGDTLVLKNASGIEEQLLYMTNDASIQNDTTFGDVSSDLRSASLDADTWYAIECFLMMDANSTTPDSYIRFNFTNSSQDGQKQVRNMFSTSESYQVSNAIETQMSIFLRDTAIDSVVIV